jgi:hypothetical protein
MNAADLSPAAYNPRKITDKKLDMLRKSMIEFGDLSGVVLNRTTGKLVGGHQRVKHFKPEWAIVATPHTDESGTVAHGYVETPWGRWTYREVSWTEKKELAANIAANKHGGEFDFPKLKEMLVEIDTGECDMELTGFELSDIELMFAGGAGPGAGTGEGEGGGKNGTLQYNIIFNVEAERDIWFRYIKFLKSAYEGETISERIAADLRATRFAGE